MLGSRPSTFRTWSMAARIRRWPRWWGLQRHSGSTFACSSRSSRARLLAPILGDRTRAANAARPYRTRNAPDVRPSSRRRYAAGLAAFGRSGTTLSASATLWLTPDVGLFIKLRTRENVFAGISGSTGDEHLSVAQQHHRVSSPCHSHAAGGSERAGAWVVQLRTRESAHQGALTVVESAGGEHLPTRQPRSQCDPTLSRSCCRWQ